MSRSDHAAALLTGGLGYDETQVVVAGLQPPGVSVGRVVRVAERAYRVLASPRAFSAVPMIVQRPGKPSSRTMARAFLVTSGVGGVPALNLGVSDAELAAAPILNDRVELQWERVEGADTYEVRDEQGIVLATVRDDGRQAYLWRSPVLADGTTRTFSVRALKWRTGEASPTLSRSVQVVTYPQDDTPAAFTVGPGRMVTVT